MLFCSSTDLTASVWCRVPHSDCVILETIGPNLQTHRFLSALPCPQVLHRNHFLFPAKRKIFPRVFTGNRIKERNSGQRTDDDEAHGQDLTGRGLLPGRRAHGRGKLLILSPSIGPRDVRCRHSCVETVSETERLKDSDVERQRRMV